MEAYIYTYVNKETGKTYIGSRSAYKGSCYDDFNIKYFSSSRNKEFRQDMADGKLDGFIVLIINEEDANKKIQEIEAQMISSYWEKFGKEKSYNLHNKSKWNTVGRSPWNKGKPKEQQPGYGKKRPGINKGEKNPFYGKHHSEETKAKMSEALKGKEVSEEAKEKISKANKGKKRSKEFCKRMSEIAKNRTGVKNPFYGKTHKKYKWISPEGEIKEMSICCAHRHHPDWIMIEDKNN